MGKCESSACRPPAPARGLRQRDRCPRPVRGSAALQQLAWRGRASEGWADQGDRSYIKSPFSNSRASGRRHAARVSGSGSSGAFDSVRRTIAATLNVGPLPATVARCSEGGPQNTRSALFTGTSRAGATGLEPATSGVTGRRSNQLSYAPGGGFTVSQAISARGRLGAGAGRRRPSLTAGATFGSPASLRRRIDLRRTHPTRPWVRCWDQRRGPCGVPVVLKGCPRCAAGS